MFTPSKERPPFVALTLAPLLEAQVEIAAAAGDVDTAREACNSLRDVATRYRSPWLGASAAVAGARVALLVDDVDTAIDACNDAIARWADLGAPYETAVARMVLAEAMERSGRQGAALLERRAAAGAFATFGAERWAARAQELVSGARSPAVDRSASTPDRATFRLDGELRHVSFVGTTTTLGDLKGFRYLARLLAEPGREFHVLDLVAVEQGTLPTGKGELVGPAELAPSDGGGVPALDEQARRAYQRRLAEVDDDIEDALRCNDTTRAELARHDREYLIAELSRAVGLAGRLRTVGGDSERARMAVTRTIRYAVGRLGSHDPALAAHLDNCIHTGTYCSYRPDPLSQVTWEL